MQLTKNLKSSEITCGCGCGYDDISPKLTQMFQKARDKYADAIIVTSGCRCQKHNTVVGGVPNSAHTKGLALDVSVMNQTPAKMQKLAFCLGYAGFERAEINASKNYIHVDIDDTKPSGVWFI